MDIFKLFSVLSVAFLMTLAGVMIAIWVPRVLSASDLDPHHAISALALIVGFAGGLLIAHIVILSLRN